MKEQFRDINLRGSTSAIIDMTNRIMRDYAGQRLSLRQVYYQFIGRDWFPEDWIDEAYNRRKNLDPRTKNTDKNYERLGQILTTGRYAGLIDWDAIEDRGRVPSTPSHWDSLQELLDVAVRQFRLNRWKGQTNYVEVWVEKQALAGVLEPICRKHHVTLMVNKGYSSASAMKESADRFIAECGLGGTYVDETFGEIFYDQTGMRFAERNDDKDEPFVWEDRIDDDELWEQIQEQHPEVKRPLLIYFGDHDPSGEDMVRDVRDRLMEFGAFGLTVIKEALTIEQVRQYRLPPNPAKVSDSRAKAYVEKFGDQSWELDALPPRVFNQMVEDSIVRYIDQDKLALVKADERSQVSRVKTSVGRKARGKYHFVRPAKHFRGSWK